MIEFIKLSPEERALEAILDEAGLLHDMGKEHFRGKKDVIVNFCPDGRHFLRGVLEPFLDMYDEMHNLCCLPLPKYGGTLILDDNSPLLLPGRSTDQDLIDDIRWAVNAGYGAMCNINHLPCGKGREYKIHCLRITDSLTHAKRRIKNRECISNITVAGFLQITDIEQDRRRLSHIPFHDYLEWKRIHGDRKILDMIARKAAEYG